jgi:predicted enzyme related to lactoylglutathione lyase
MPEMTSYRHGVPAWGDVSANDIEASCAFYAGLFGWDNEDLGPDAGGYRLFRKNGLMVAGIGSTSGGPPAWSTYFAVDDIQQVAASIAAAGGTLAVPPMELPNDSGSIAFGIDPTGGFFGLFQAGPNHLGAQLVNEPGTVTWNELNVRDPETACAFYDKLLGFQTMAMPGADTGYRVITLAGRWLAGVMPMGDNFPPGIPTNWLTYFAVENADEACARCTELGGTVMAPPFDTMVGPMAVLTDPAGAVFAIGAFTDIDDPNAWPA